MLPQVEKNAMLDWFCVLLLPYLLIGVINTSDFGEMNGNKSVFSKQTIQQKLGTAISWATE